MRRPACVFAGLTVFALAQDVRADLPLAIPAEDTFTHARASERRVHISTWFEALRAPEQDGSTATIARWVQIGVNPSRLTIPFRGASLRSIEHWMPRIRFGLTRGHDNNWVGTPMTLALQRATALQTLDNAPLAHLQFGMETALSTPWVAGSRYHPRYAFRALHGPDTELAQNGWSIRPFSFHVRLDIPACRSYYVELGAGTELFRSMEQPDRPTEYGARWHGAFGVGLACMHRSGVFLNDMMLTAQYRGRAALYRGELDPTADHAVALALQYDRRTVALSLYGSIAPGYFIGDFYSVGLRVQLALGGPKR